ncbi:MAG: hypothetical protein HC933_02190 [Pleurocapsa sp. SU_196_0]|nr:hypothetical protein [Pleurocapsa sp. SU_196_0]
MTLAMTEDNTDFNTRSRDWAYLLIAQALGVKIPNGSSSSAQDDWVPL